MPFVAEILNATRSIPVPVSNEQPIVNHHLPKLPLLDPLVTGVEYVHEQLKFPLSFFASTIVDDSIVFRDDTAFDTAHPSSITDTPLNATVIC